MQVLQRISTRLSTAAIALALVSSAGAATWSDSFDTNTAANYTVNADPDTQANFNYDYSAMGIPSAPHSAGGTTRGVQFKANAGDATAAAAAINISPTAASFTGDIVLRFDLWMNTNGPFPAGGSGSTTFFTGGVGTAGASIQKSSGTADGAWFAGDVDGNHGFDYRAYVTSALQNPTTGAYAAGNIGDGSSSDARNAQNPYYHTTFPGYQEPPPLQQTNYPSQQTGQMWPGTLGLLWRDVEITKSGNTVSWKIDGLPIATLTNPPLAGNNVFIGFWDPFTSISDPDLNFAVMDNLQVSPLPEPGATCALVGFASALLLRRRFEKSQVLRHHGEQHKQE